MIASSFQGFIKVLEEMKRLSEGRNNPVQIERNPVSAIERERALSRLAELNQNVFEFWENWFAV